MSQFYNGTIPTWRLLSWVIVAMVGLVYFSQPEGESQWYLRWGPVLLVGVAIGGFGLILNWTRTERARAWVQGHSRLVRTVFAAGVFGSALLKLIDIVFRQR